MLGTDEPEDIDFQPSESRPPDPDIASFIIGQGQKQIQISEINIHLLNTSMFVSKTFRMYWLHFS